MTKEAKGLIELIELMQIEPRTGIEIGVYRGETSKILLRYFPDLTLYMLDLWAPSPHKSYRASGDSKAKISGKWLEHYDATIENVSFAKDRARVVRGDVLRPGAARNMDLVDVDFIFLDADHSYNGTRTAIGIWSELVRPGGLIAGHDYRQEFPGVIRAVDAEVAHREKAVSLTSGSVWGFRNDP